MSVAVQNMFADIAARYDIANDVLSFGIHRLWRKKAVRSLGLTPQSVVLDVCSGTGDVAFEIAKHMRNGAQEGDGGKIIAVDFVPEMLAIAKEKGIRTNYTNIEFLQGDAMNLHLNLDLAPQSFDSATIAFGIRNVDSPIRCLEGIRKVLKPGGRLAVLEFGRPINPAFRLIYWFYARFILPILGWCITGNKAAYEYLPRTSWAFPCGEDFLKMMASAGFAQRTSTPLFGGIAYLYVGEADNSR